MMPLGAPGRPASVARGAAGSARIVPTPAGGGRSVAADGGGPARRRQDARRGGAPCGRRAAAAAATAAAMVVVFSATVWRGGMREILLSTSTMTAVQLQASQTVSRREALTAPLPPECGFAPAPTGANEPWPAPATPPTQSAPPLSASAAQRPIPALGGTCVPVRAPHRVAFAIAYDLSEGSEKLPLRNAQFSRVFKGLRDTGSDADLVLIVPSEPAMKLRAVTAGLDAYGVKVVRMEMPFEEADLAPRHAEFLRSNPNCCGWREFYKFVAWKLVQYERVMLLDSDLQIVGSVDHLLRCGHRAFLATPGFFSPLNGGLWVLTPSLCTFRDMVRLVLEGSYTNRDHWGGLSMETNHVGAEGPQGFLYYYFFVLPRLPGTALQRGEGGYVDKCVYNSNLNFCSSSNVIGGKVYIVHKPTFRVPRRWFNQFVEDISANGTSTAAAKSNIADRAAPVEPAARPAGGAAAGRATQGGAGRVHVVIAPRSRDPLAHCNLGDRLLRPGPADADLDAVVERHGWPSQGGSGVPGKGALRYVLLAQKPYDVVMDALERRDPGPIGATGALAKAVREGRATVRDYIASAQREARLNPLTWLLAATGRKFVGKTVVTRNDLRVALTRMLGLEATVVLADRPAESLLLLSNHLGVNVTAASGGAPGASLCYLGRVGEPPRFRRPDGDKAVMREINRLHSFDFRLYGAARRVFRRQFYHAFRHNPAVFEEKAASLACPPGSLVCAEGGTEGGNVNASGATGPSAPTLPVWLPPQMASRVHGKEDAFCSQRCELRPSLAPEPDM